MEQSNSYYRCRIKPTGSFKLNNMERIPNICKEYKYANFIFVVLSIILISQSLFLSSISDIISINFLHQITDCFYKQHTGNNCPTCGLTRSILALYSGNIDLSIYYHPEGIVLFAFLCIQTILRLVPSIINHVLIPYIDIIQLIVSFYIFRFVTDH